MSKHYDTLETRSQAEREKALMQALPQQVAHAKDNAPFFGQWLKDIDPARLPLALHGVLEGEAALPRQLVALLIEEFRERRRRRRVPLRGRRSAELTDREWEVLELMRQGASTEEIAARLFISPVTVRTHVSAILRKLQVPTREAAIELLER